VTTPPRIWSRVDGETEGRASAQLDSGRILHGLPVEVQPLASWLLGRLQGERPGADPAPTPASLELLAAAVRPLREAILVAEEQGADRRSTRAMHGRLDRDFALLGLRVLEGRTEDSRSLLRDVSHDLRSPLNSILFLADALATGHSGELNDVQRRQVDVLYSAAVSLVGLVNDLLDVARLGDATTIEVVSEPFSVEKVLQQVDQLVGPLARHGGIDLAFRLETLGPRVGDRRLMTRILINLVSNAVQATAPGGRVEVRVVERDEGLRVTVTDSGSDADIEALRARLRDAPLPGSGERTHGWTHGLGLAIYSRLVRAANGSLGVDAPSEGGCRFTLVLPFGRGT
jgi:signal transduction histidine kinase